MSYYNGQSYIFTWQEGRQLASAAIGDSTYNYKYNQDGIRVEKTVGNYIYEYILDGTKVVRELVSSTSGTLVKDSYFYYDLNGYIESAKIETYDLNASEYILIFRTNIQGDVVEILDTEGVTLVTYQYDAYGNFIENIEAEQNINLIASQTPFKYRGYIYDQETGLYYLNSRYYDPKVGRFISADDVGAVVATPEGLTDKNLYAYCDNNPITRIDNGGEFWRILAGSIIGVAEQLTLDLIEYIFTGECDSTFSDYVGAIVGGAVEGAICGTVGVTLGAAVDTLVKMTCDNIYYEFIGDGEHYTIDEIIDNSLYDSITAGMSNQIINSVGIKVNLFNRYYKETNYRIVNYIVEKGMNWVADELKKFLNNTFGISYD